MYIRLTQVPRPNLLRPQTARPAQRPAAPPSRPASAPIVRRPASAHAKLCPEPQKPAKKPLVRCTKYQLQILLVWRISLGNFDELHTAGERVE